VGESSLDARLIGLEPGDDGNRLRFALDAHLCRPDGALYGGTAIAATCAAMEVVTGRPTLWASTQLVASAQHGDVVDVLVESLARGTYIDQVRVTATVGSALLFTAVGSAATPRTGGITGTGLTMPAVSPPEASPERESRGHRWGDGELGHHRVVHFLDAVATDGRAAEPGRMTIWGRLQGETTNTAAKLGFLADMVPVAVCAAAGAMGAGTSLDNSLRVAHLVDSDWVLLDLRGQAAADGYGYGECHLWSPDGVLLGTGTQTAKLFTFDSFFGAGR
jgi:acyl-CoA thioesterase